MADPKQKVKILADLNPPLRSRPGRKLTVLGVARISGKNQDEKSLADQEALYRGWLKQRTHRPFTLIMIATRGSGERLDRRELRRLRKLVRSQRIDIVLARILVESCGGCMHSSSVKCARITTYGFSRSTIWSIGSRLTGG